MDWLVAFSAMMFSTLLFAGPAFNLLRLDVQSARISSRGNVAKITKR